MSITIKVLTFVCTLYVDGCDQYWTDGYRKDVTSTWHWEYSDMPILFPQWNNIHSNPDRLWLANRYFDHDDEEANLPWGLVNIYAHQDECYTCEISFQQPYP